MRRDVRGFSLLEAIVALAILAAAGLALFAAMTQSMQMLGRVERAREVDGALLNALATIEQVNPMDTPRGEMPLGAFVVRWTAVPVEPPRENRTTYLYPGLYEVGLYVVRMDLWRDGVLERSVELRRAGYRQVRKPAAL